MQETRLPEVTRMVAIAALLMLAAAVVAQGAAQGAAAGAVAALQGTWSISTVNGQVVAGIGTTMSFTFTGDKYVHIVNGQVKERGVFKIGASQKPMAIDMRITEGLGAGQTQIGLVQIVGDTMTLKTNTVGTPLRPTDFKPQLWYVLIVAKRSK